MVKTLKDYPEAINRINEAILSNYGKRVDTLQKFQVAFNSYMNGEQYTQEDVNETYSRYTDINKFAEKTFYVRTKTFDSEIESIRINKTGKQFFNKIGYSRHRQIRAREWIVTSKITGKKFTVLRDSKGRILSKSNKWLVIKKNLIKNDRLSIGE